MRLFFNTALIVSILYLPWWVGALVLVAGCFVVEHFYEAILYGILVDVLYGSKLGFYGFVYTGSLFALLFFTLSALLRDKLSW